MVYSSYASRFIIQVEESIEPQLTEENLKRWHESFLPSAVEESGVDRRLLHSYSDVFSGFAAMLTEDELQASKDKDILIVCLYVDDLIFTGSNPSMFGEFKEVMTKEFEMTDIGLMAYYLGIEGNQREDGSFISQAGYAREILKQFRMDNSKSINTPVKCGVKLSKHDEEEKVDPIFFKSLVGSLRYLTCTRPDILYAVGLVSRYMEDPTTTHLKIAKRILRYIKGTIDFGLFYSTSNHFKLEGYSDSDWGGDIDDRKSTTGFVFFMGDIAFTWICGAGNDGPDNFTLGNEAPWVLTVGASSVDRSFRASVRLPNGKVIPGESLDQSHNFTKSFLPLYYSTESPTCDIDPPVHNHRGSVWVCKVGSKLPKDVAPFVKSHGARSLIFIISKVEGATVVIRRLNFPGILGWLRPHIIFDLGF
ncbi:hypothetical protein ZIOFF_009766 [Zingiber officinale]|uniref:Reverse transcriptase Ty1/copia-type domain-containing protein n=1 Tax=Zingiber officinale TaxID=94328 RepID=A0A8J5LJL9_ZINOF|nr:hypothetical protein ZIOFF_009766 [Zingiber officinale]